MSILRMRPGDVIDPCWLEEYERNIDAIWWQLTRLNGNMYVLKKMRSFPFGLFAPEPPPRHFWALVEKALIESSMMAIWRTAVDPQAQGLTLQQMRNKIHRHIHDAKHREEFKSELRSAAFRSSLSALAPKIESIRHNYIAHFNRQRNTSPTPQQVKESHLLFSELEGYCNCVNSCFKLLCFGCWRAESVLEYDPGVIHPADIDSRSDIERLLDDVARDSAVTNMPEKEPSYWSTYRARLSQDELETLNRYRAKFGLPTV